MGCTQSKIDMEESVLRCKDRKKSLQQALNYRNAFAAAHSAYVIALKNTGAALSDYAHSDLHDLRSSSSAANNSTANSTASVPVIRPPADQLPPPPPLPDPDFNPSPLLRSASMPQIPIPKPSNSVKSAGPSIREEDDHDLLEDSSDDDDHDFHHDHDDHKGSSFGEKEQRTAHPPPKPQPQPQPQPIARPSTPPMVDTTAWDYFFQPDHNMMPSTLSQAEVENWTEVKRVETPAPASVVHEVRPMPPPVTMVVTEFEKWTEIKRAETPAPASVIHEVPPMPPPVRMGVTEGQGQGMGASKMGMKKQKAVLHQHAASTGGDGKRGGKLVAVPPKSLLQVLTELDDLFLKASESGHEVSKMLEATRMHYHSNFADNRGLIDHSARVMRVITWNRSFKGVAQSDEDKDDFDSEESETHATVLDKMLAWEKKLYDEVKAGEIMKIEYQKKVALLKKLKKRGAQPEALEKAKSALSHLHTRYIVDIQSMDSTVSEINRLRDKQLYPKLVELVKGMAKMWGTMHGYHAIQLNIINEVRAHDVLIASRETSRQHSDRTLQLLQMVREWHSQFEKLMSNQKEYIKALNNWLRLNLIPIESSLKEKVSSPPRQLDPPIKALLLAWRDELERLPDDLARTAIKSFSIVIEGIVSEQEKELKQFFQCENARRNLDKRKQEFAEWHRKYADRMAAASEGVNPENSEGANPDPVAERRLGVEGAEIRLKEEEEAYRKLCKQVREKSLESIRTHLPELFRNVASFALASSQMYKKLDSITTQESSIDE